MAPALPFGRFLHNKENAMSKEHPAHRENLPEKNAAHTQNEKSDRIKGQQVTDATSPETDLPRGSEPETRGTSGRR